MFWSLTFYIPDFFIGWCGLKKNMQRKDVKTAWREKFAIFILILLACCSTLFFIIVLPRLICPKVEIKSVYEIEGMNNVDDPFVTINGRYYQIGDIVKDHIGKIGVDKFQMQGILGLDVSQSFYPTADWDKSCPGVTNPGPTWDNLLERDPQKYWPHYVVDSRTNTPSNYLGFLAKHSKGRIGWRKDYLASLNDPTKKIIIMYDNVYNVAAYFQGQSAPGFFDDNMHKIFTNMAGKDATFYIESLREQDPVYYRNVLNCMNNIFYVGTIDNRNSFQCKFANYVLLAASAIIVAVIGFKFLAALRSMHTTNPEDIDKYVLIQIPCYTEGKDSLEATFNSIATTNYDDKYKLMVVICDGIITGHGNNKSTPDIALEILCGGEEQAEKAKNEAGQPVTYMAVADKSKIRNRAVVYSGLYEHKGHNLPYIVVVKVGSEKETKKPGNRGKRDSQIILMKFLQHIYGKNMLNELEYELYHHMKNIVGISPDKFEYTLMVDADTFITPDSITKMVSCMISNKRIIGLCGETFVANEKDNITTMIQVYEYFISHHLAKAFESMFGSVTCLPGCFCMYRIRTKNNIPLLISPSLIEEYADPDVDTLHKKNMLHIGEDRYLTTLVLKHFPKYQTMFTPDAQCYTNAPDSFMILMSQRRRWINSTIHNLIELLNLGSQLCGVCFMSMRFVIFIDLLSTIVLPASVVYIGYLVYTIIVEKTGIPMISLILIGAIYALQVIIFVLKKKFEHVGWMLIYILAIPFFNGILPLYAFWNMDDFNWGDTRVAIGDDGRTIEFDEEGGGFTDTDVEDKNGNIQLKKLIEWEMIRDQETKIKEEQEVVPDIVRINYEYSRSIRSNRSNRSNNHSNYSSHSNHSNHDHYSQLNGNYANDGYPMNPQHPIHYPREPPINMYVPVSDVRQSPLFYDDSQPNMSSTNSTSSQTGDFGMEQESQIRIDKQQSRKKGRKAKRMNQTK